MSDEWPTIQKCLAVTSLVVGGIATGLPETYSKILFAVALGLSNAAIYLRKDANNGSGTRSKDTKV